jgi:predicted NAD-dependent protein-ADP-ribosyltransferase YbiA (DUF1768 family)
MFRLDKSLFQTAKYAGPRPKPIRIPAPALVDLEIPEMTDKYADLDLSTARVERSEAGPRSIIHFDLPLSLPQNEPKKHYIEAVVDRSTRVGVVIFRSVGPLSNHSNSPMAVEVGGQTLRLQCAEQAFALGKMTVMLDKAFAVESDADKWTAFCDVYRKVLTAAKPFKSNAATNEVPKGSYDDALWALHSKNAMMTAQLLKLTSSEAAFARFDALVKLVRSACDGGDVMLMEANDKNWGCGCSGSVMRENLTLRIPGLNAKAVAEELAKTEECKKEVGHNKLGEVFGWVLDFLKYAEACVPEGSWGYEAFCLAVEATFGPLVELAEFPQAKRPLEDADAPPSPKCARV